MASVVSTPKIALAGDPDYPTGDGKPMAETTLHRILMNDLIGTLSDRLAADPMANVGGNLLLFYEEGNKHRHVSPDVYVTLGVPKEPMRINYILWLEGKPPDVVIELTSRTTRKEDQVDKLELYRDVLKVPEYFLFDPTEDYLRPSLQGYRLAGGVYAPIEEAGGRLRCESLGLDLGREGEYLRLYDADTGARLPTQGELLQQERMRIAEERRIAGRERRRADRAAARAEEAQRRAKEERQRAEEERQRAEKERQRAEEERQRAGEERARAERADAENQRLLREIEELKRRLGQP